ncbi:nuclear transport factor 2 family protein [Mycolicibacterium vinylchloridicum]|uniref:nuclear transport factor 2 family protein n=1 Tax=Mycolicibacterium vinylchloridicum TaxID=2736928 RepID=UPI0015CD9B87|nr:nuclear transport factor 2 family protein [Mycolicibacterium vinylchloridicum]
MSVGSVKVVSHLFESLAAGDIDAMVANFHPEIVVKEADNLPFGGLHQGVKAFREDLLGGIAAGADPRIVMSGDNIPRGAGSWRSLLGGKIFVKDRFRILGVCGPELQPQKGDTPTSQTFSDPPSVEPSL